MVSIHGHAVLRKMPSSSADRSTHSFPRSSKPVDPGFAVLVKKGPAM